MIATDALQIAAISASDSTRSLGHRIGAAHRRIVELIDDAVAARTRALATSRRVVT